MAEKIIQYLADVDIAHVLDELPEPHNTLVGHMHTMGVIVTDRTDDSAKAHAVVAELTNPYDGQVEEIVRVHKELGKSVLLMRQFSPYAKPLPDELTGVGSLGRGGIVGYKGLDLARLALTTFMGVSFEGEPRIQARGRFVMSLREEMRRAGLQLPKKDIAELDAADEADRREHGYLDE